jgi:hypothetical protein
LPQSLAETWKPNKFNTPHSPRLQQIQVLLLLLLLLLAVAKGLWVAGGISAVGKLQQVKSLRIEAMHAKYLLLS